MSMIINKPEILAPAGDFERLEAAVLFGADAVYLGGNMFGMRSSPANFSPDELTRAVRYCHARGVKAYLTCNTLPLNRELDELPEFIRHAAYDARVDALIIADVGVLALAKKIAPELEIHISTQAGVVNYLTANELYRLGANRIVLARELALGDIAKIRDKTPPELQIEAFAHGAMCISFSGRCFISQYLVGRDGNRGECAQPCRWGYHLMEEKRPGQFFPVFEDERGSYILNAQDMCVLPYIDKLAQAGVTSLKIEGRAKSAYYVAAITNAYSIAARLYAADPAHYEPPAWLIEETHKVSHRRYSTGFYFENEPPAQFYETGGYVREWEVAAVVEGWKDGVLICTERNRFSCGDTLEILSPGKRPDTFIPREMFDEEGNSLQTARHPMMLLKIPCETAYPKGSMLRRKTGCEN